MKVRDWQRRAYAVCLSHVLGDKFSKEQRRALNKAKCSYAVDGDCREDQAMAPDGEIERVIGVRRWDWEFAQVAIFVVEQRVEVVLNQDGVAQRLALLFHVCHFGLVVRGCVGFSTFGD